MPIDSMKQRRVYGVIYDIWGVSHIRKSRYKKFTYEEIAIMLGTDDVNYMKLNTDFIILNNNEFLIIKPYYFFNPDAINIPLEPNEHAFELLKPLGVTELPLGNIVIIDSKKFEKWKK